MEDDFNYPGPDPDPAKWGTLAGSWTVIDIGGEREGILTTQTNNSRLIMAQDPPQTYDDETKRIIVDVRVRHPLDQLVVEFHRDQDNTRWGILFEERTEDINGDEDDVGWLSIVTWDNAQGWIYRRQVELGRSTRDEWFTLSICVQSDDRNKQRYILASLSNAADTFEVSLNYQTVQDPPHLDRDQRVTLWSLVVDDPGTGEGQIEFDNFSYNRYQSAGYEHCPGCADSNKCVHCYPYSPNQSVFSPVFPAAASAPRYMQLTIDDGGQNFDPTSSCPEAECRAVINNTYLLRWNDNGCAYDLKYMRLDELMPSGCADPYPYVGFLEGDIANHKRVEAGIVFTDTGPDNILYMRDDIPEVDPDEGMDCFQFYNYKMTNNSGEGFPLGICDYSPNNLADWTFLLTSIR